jgi:hypothetical protein
VLKYRESSFKIPAKMCLSETGYIAKNTGTIYLKAAVTGSGTITDHEHDHVSRQRVYPCPFALILFRSETGHGSLASSSFQP